MFGFTQPQTALPIIQDSCNNTKGFTSRILWYFPQPTYCKMSETYLNVNEKGQVKHFKNELGKSNVYSYNIKKS